MKRSAIGAAVLSSVVLTACTMTLPVRGKVQDSSETLTGTATGYLNGGGNMTIKSSKGVTCTGGFVYVTRRNGEGVINCDDGRSGPFQFVSTGTSGTGHGDFGKERFTFIFGS
jgi:hypothetical protein